jgi:uncharacterized membrane protein YgcG
MMQRRQFLVPLLAASALAAALAAAPVAAASLEEQVVNQLREQGFTEIRMSRTLLGRVRITAEGRGYEREIILNPRTGEILRDFWDDADKDAGLLSPNQRDDDSGRGDAEGHDGQEDDSGDDSDSGSDDGGSDDSGSDDSGGESDGGGESDDD